MGTKIVIQQGSASTSAQTLELFPINATGDPDACRRLVYPTAVSDLIPPLVYSFEGLCFNPKRTLNFDLDALVRRNTAAVKTLGTTQVIDFPNDLDDVIVTEIWTAEAGLSMPVAMWRELYTYYRNPPGSSNFVIWEPRDRTTKRFNIQILDLNDGSDFDVNEIRSKGGGTIASATSAIEPTPAGLIDSEVRLRFRIVGEAT